MTARIAGFCIVTTSVAVIAKSSVAQQMPAAEYFAIASPP
jgi:hypothetical protein